VKFGGCSAARPSKSIPTSHPSLTCSSQHRAPAAPPAAPSPQAQARSQLEEQLEGLVAAAEKLQAERAGRAAAKGRGAAMGVSELRA
jgi:hypothetical protein